jgi:hypothetical protein
MPESNAKEKIVAEKIAYSAQVWLIQYKKQRDVIRWAISVG